MQIIPFWMVLRLSGNGTVQQIDSLPHKRYPVKRDALDEAERLASRNPNAFAFVVLEAVGGSAARLQLQRVLIQSVTTVANDDEIPF